MKYSESWKDYSVITTSDGYKLERWGDITLLRPDPQVIWKSQTDILSSKCDAKYIRSNKGGGHWEYNRTLPEKWIIGYKDLKFIVKPMNFKHMGLFPEQAVNWDKMEELIRNANRPISVLNLFAYTGGATCACLNAGASVCHVDASKGMVEQAGENVRLNDLEKHGVRFIIDDCLKFVKREIRRGKRYDAIIMDPPSFGRGANGETWKIEDNLFELVQECAKLMSDTPLFFLINSYTTGLQPQVLKNILSITLGDKKGSIEAYEVGLPAEDGVILPCGAGGIYIYD